MAASKVARRLSKESLGQHSVSFQRHRSTELAYVQERVQQKTLEGLLRSSPWPPTAVDGPVLHQYHVTASHPIESAGSSNRDVSTLLNMARQLAGTAASDHWPCSRFVVDGMLGREGDFTAEEQEQIADAARQATSEMIDKKIKRQNKARVKRLTRQGSVKPDEEHAAFRRWD